MNPFSPILPPGSPLARPLVQRRSHVRTVFFVVAGVSVFALVVMLRAMAAVQRPFETQFDEAYSAENKVIVA